MRSSASAQRDAMFAQVSAGAGAVASVGDARGKIILGRGCDPVMAEKSVSFLPPLLGGATVIAFSDDNLFLQCLEDMRDGKRPKPDVVFFAPGACRWSAARRPIPGGNSVSHGWRIEEYHAFVRTMLGADTIIVGTEHESEMVPLLRAALGL